MVKSAGHSYRSQLTSVAEAGLFCCISAFLTFTRGAHVWVEGVVSGGVSETPRALQGVIFLLWIGSKQPLVNRYLDEEI